ncbi:unnamed protein product [Phytophthora fragariaefolia]|uniref:Unnamed protein product n=1 Tax=Phytophthora fragariaefolia TaxID=1490495 RepID=A0A9W6Y1C8_9STRA|nr:unnamed protein product [Phytophthora fragariaefolia]
MALASAFTTLNFTAQTGSVESYEPKPTDLQRIARPSAKWFSKLASRGCLDGLAQADEITAMRTAAKQEPQVTTEEKTFSGLLSICILVVAAIIIATWRRRQGYAATPRSKGTTGFACATQRPGISRVRMFRVECR